MISALDEYRLLEQVAATPDRVRYRAVHVDSAQPVEVQVFKTGDADRWRRCHRRVKLAQMVQESGIRPVLAYEPKAESPFVVLPEFVGRTLLDELGSDLPIGPQRAIEIVSQIVVALDAAHRVGLAHGSIAPEHVAIAGHPPQNRRGEEAVW